MVKRVLSFRAAKTERDYRVRFTTALSEQIDPRITSSALKKYTTNQKGDIVTKAIIDFRISLFRKMPILRRVIIEDPTSMFPLVDGSLNFLSHSLKRLRIASQTYPDRGITATKACWLLTFCPMLLQAVLGFTISIEDHQFLKEHSEAFERKSNVREIASEFAFHWTREDQRTWWGFPGEESKTWEGGNQKSEAISLLLKIIKDLSSCEISVHHVGARPGDRSPAFTACIS